MGCDIHLFVERNTTQGWQPAEPMVEGWRHEDPLIRGSFYDGRNYSPFAMLANVRNGVGFAGVDRGEPVKPIADPRGIPDDISAETRQAIDDYGLDGHSHSHFTIRELLDVDWFGNGITHRGWVDPKNFDRWRRWGKPDSWSGSVEGGGVQHVSNDLMAQMIDEGVVKPDTQQTHFASHYTQVEWTEPWADAAGEFMGSLVRMAHLADGDLDSVRAVFFFDN